MKIILERLLNALADVGVGGEVHHQFDVFGAQNLADSGFVAQLGLVKWHIGRDGGAVTVDQIIQHDGPVSGFDELANAMAADVSGAAYN